MTIYETHRKRPRIKTHFYKIRSLVTLISSTLEVIIKLMQVEVAS